MALLLAGALSDCGGSPAPAGGAAAAVSTAGGVTELAPAQRLPAPALAGETLDGKPLYLAEFRGKVVVSTCGARDARRAAPRRPPLQRVWQDTRARGAQFLGVNPRDSTPAAQAFERRYGITYPSLADEDGSLLLAFRDTLPPQAVPSTLIVDRQGRVAALMIGVVPDSTLHALLDPQLAELTPEP